MGAGAGRAGAGGGGRGRGPGRRGGRGLRPGLDGPPGDAPREVDGIDPAALAAAADLGGGGDPAALAAIAGQLRGTGIPEALLEAARGTAGVGEEYYRALEALEGDDLSDMEEFGDVVGDG